MITIDLGPAPTPPLSLNRERTMHHMKRHRLLKPWKDTAATLCRSKRVQRAIGGRAATVTVVLPVKGNYRRDPHNYLPPVKAIIDGMVAAGVWPDDTPTWVKVNEPILENNGVNVLVLVEPWDEAAA